MLFFAIKQLSTGLFVPFPKSGHHMTSAEPNEKSPPRLFKTKQAAANCLKFYGKGIHVQAYNRETGEFIGGNEIVRSRNPKDYKIVTVEVYENGPSIPASDTRETK